MLKRRSAILGIGLALALVSVAPMAGLAMGKQRELHYAHQFLEASKPALRLNFLLWPDLEGLLDGYEYSCVSTINKVDKQLQQKKLLLETVTEAKWDGRAIRYVQTPPEDSNLHLRNGPMYIISATGQLEYPSNGSAGYDLQYRLLGQIGIRDRIWSETEFGLLGREDLAGRPTLVFTFRTSKKLQKDARFTGRAAQAEGKLWFDEEDRVLVRVEGQHYANATISKSVISSRWNPKGTRWSWQLRRTDGGNWIPEYHEFLLRSSKGIFFRRFSHWYREFFRWSDVRRPGAQREREPGRPPGC